MSQVDLKRIQNDLDSMNQVIRRDRPYAAADVLPCVVVGLGAIVCIGLLHWQLLSDARLCLLLSISPGLVLWARPISSRRVVVARSVRCCGRNTNGARSRPLCWFPHVSLGCGGVSIWVSVANRPLRQSFFA